MRQSSRCLHSDDGHLLEEHKSEPRWRRASICSDGPNGSGSDRSNISDKTHRSSDENCEWRGKETRCGGGTAEERWVANGWSGYSNPMWSWGSANQAATFLLRSWRPQSHAAWVGPREVICDVSARLICVTTCPC